MILVVVVGDESDGHEYEETCCVVDMEPVRESAHEVPDGEDITEGEWIEPFFESIFVFEER